MRARAASRAILTLSLLSTTLAGQVMTDSESVFYRYFDKPIRCQVDLTRLGAFTAPGSSIADLMQSAVGQGRRVAAVESLGETQISFLSVDPPFGSVLELRQVLTDLSQSPAVRSMSPILLMPPGTWMLFTNKLLVRFDANPGGTTEDIQVISQELGEYSIRSIRPLTAWLPGSYVVELNDSRGFDVLDAANRLSQLPNAIWAEPSFLLNPSLDGDTCGPPGGTPSIEEPDYLDGGLWHISNHGNAPSTMRDFDIAADHAWCKSTGTPGVRVLVLDSGVKKLHPDLSKVVDGRNFVTYPAEQQPNNDGSPNTDFDTHGTAMAGLIAADANGLMVIGIAPGCSLVSARIMHQFGPTPGESILEPQWIIDALAWGTDPHGGAALITNSSFRIAPPLGSLRDMYQVTADVGITHVASAGNHNTSLDNPAVFPSTIAVGAVMADGSRWPMSNKGTFNSDPPNGVELDVMAPGGYAGSILSTGADGFVAETGGTSAAAAMVSGIAALMRSTQASINGEYVRYVLRRTARELPSDDWPHQGYDDETGFGLVNVSNVLQFPLRIIGTGSGASLSWRGRHCIFTSGAGRVVIFDRHTERLTDLGPGTASPRRGIDSRGRFVVLSTIQKHAPNDTNEIVDIYRLDRDVDMDGVFDEFLESGATEYELVSASQAGVAGDAPSTEPSMSPDGRYVVFRTLATNLGSVFNPPGVARIVRKDLAGGAAVTVNWDVVSGNSVLVSAEHAVVADFGEVLFSSSHKFGGAAMGGVYMGMGPTATLIAPGGTSPMITGSADYCVYARGGQIYRRSLGVPIGAETLVSVSTSGGPANGLCQSPTVSADGQRVAFLSNASNLVVGGTTVTSAYVRDFGTNTTCRISSNQLGAPGDNIARPVISPDGESAAFDTPAALVVGDGNNQNDVYMFSAIPCIAPVIATQPVSQSVGCGLAFFSVETGPGATPPPTYQWQKDGVDIPNGMGRVLMVDACQTTEGTYRVVVKNACGAVVSNGATLTVSETASAAPYGSGHPGSGGIVPQISAPSLPTVGGKISILVEHALHAPAASVILIAFAPAQIPFKGGTILVALPEFMPIASVLPAGPKLFELSLPINASLCGIPLYLQFLSADPGASNGIAMSAGLHLVLGS